MTSQELIALGRLLTEENISFGSYLAMHEAHRRPLNFSDVAILLGRTSAAITGVVDRLEKRGFVQRGKNSLDRRGLRLLVDPRIMERMEQSYERFLREEEEKSA